MRTRTTIPLVFTTLCTAASWGFGTAAKAQDASASPVGGTSASVSPFASANLAPRTPLHTSVTSATVLPSASARPLSPMVPVRLRSSPGPTSFYLVDPAASGEAPKLAAPVTGEPAQGPSGRWYWPLCTSPCAMEIAPGRYQVAVGDGATEPLEAKGEVAVKAGSELLVRRKSRANIRGFGWVLGVTGGTAMTLGFRDLNGENAYPTASTAALAFGLLGVATGTIMILQQDALSASASQRAGALEEAKSSRHGVGPALPTSGRSVGPTWSGRF